MDGSNGKNKILERISTQNPNQNCESNSCSTNHNNNNEVNAAGKYFNNLEQENFYLRTQLQSLLQELKAKEELEVEQKQCQSHNSFSEDSENLQLVSKRIISGSSSCLIDEGVFCQRPGGHPMSSSVESSSIQQKKETEDFGGSKLKSRSSYDRPVGECSAIITGGTGAHTRAGSGPVGDLGYYQPRSNSGDDSSATSLSRRESVKERLQALEVELAETAVHQRSLELERQRALTHMLSSSSIGTGEMIPSTSGRDTKDEQIRTAESASNGKETPRTTNNRTSQIAVASLESKVEALERKYELQAVKHRQLTNELTRLRRQPSSGDLEYQGGISIEIQTSPEEGAVHWPLPGADAVHGSPQRCTSIRRAASDSPKRGAHLYSLAQDQIQVPSSSAVDNSSGNILPCSGGGYLSTSPPNSSAGFRHYQRQHRSSLPSTAIAHSIGFPASRRSPSQLVRQQECTVRDFGPKDQVTKTDLLDWVSKHPIGRLFRARFQYLPLRDSPNERPELELSLEPGDYVLIEGDLDEDLFYRGISFTGERGLVPSNYVERVPDYELCGSSIPSTSRSPPRPLKVSSRSLEASKATTSTSSSSSHRQSSLPLPPPPSSATTITLTLPSPSPRGKETSIRNPGVRNHNPSIPGINKKEFAVNNTGGLMMADYLLENNGDSPSTPLPESLCPYPAVDVSRVSVHEVRQMDGARVPCPRDLLVEKELAKSIVISWSPPDSGLSPVTQYHVCVDGNVKAIVPGGYKTKALIEDLDSSFFHRVSVRSVTESGHSSDAQCTVTIGKGISVAPEDVKVTQVTPVSAQVTWYPSNSNCEHLVLLNGLKVGACPPGVHQVLIKGLIPSTMYRCAVRAKYPRAVLEEKPVESFVDFKTLPKIGLPDPPGNVQCDPGPQDWTLLITWEPVTNQPKPPSRAAVSGYMIYADGKKITEVNSPSGDHALLRMSDFMDDPPLFITVRTRTKEGAVSADSNVVRVPRTLQGTTALSPKKSLLTPPTTTAQHPMQSPKKRYLETQAPTSVITTVASDSQQQAGGGFGGGLLMVQPSPPIGQQSPIHTATVHGTLPQVSTAAGVPGGPGFTQVLPAVTTTPLQGLQTPYTVYTLPAQRAAMTSGVTYSHPSGAATLVAAPGAGGQYYVFHPRLTRTEPGGEKPSLLEMENNYLVKHNLFPYNVSLTEGRSLQGAAPSALQAQQPVIPSAVSAGVQYALGEGPPPYQMYSSRGNSVGGPVRTLPVINHATGLPFRSDQYAQAWQTLSPATRRRLEQYINQPFPTSSHFLDYDSRRDHLNKRRAAWRKRSFSADEDLQYHDPYTYATAVPRIQITGASGSEGPGSIIEFSEEDWDYSYPSKPSARFRRKYYQQANSRAQSEPDLRVDQRLMALNRSRYVMALYDYEPRHMSPNPNAAQEELSFRKGQIIEIFGSRDIDGFYRGELNGRRGLVPGNMVAAVDKERIYGMQEAAYSQRIPPVEYDHPYYAGDIRPAVPVPVSVVRKRAEQWPHNSSDPALNSRFKAAGAGNYSDFESSPPAGPAARAEDPRLRRMRFQQVKSRSLDYYRGGKEDYPSSRAPPPPYRATPSSRYPLGTEVEYERRRNYAQVSEHERNYGRGSLDRRDRTRDYSLPARSPSEQEFFVPRGGRYAERERPAFELGEPADFDRRAPATDRDYYGRREGRYGDEYDIPRRRGASESRFYDETRRRFDGESPRYRYGEEKRKLEEERYRSDREREEARRRAGMEAAAGERYYADAGRGAVTVEDYDSRSGPPPRDQFEQFYDQAGAPNKRRGRSGRDNLEQNIRDAVREVPPKKMIARFDYDPRESSPNVDAETTELTFRSGDMILIYGDIDDDGFYIGELRGKRGLVPSNFLEPLTSPVQPLPPPPPPLTDEQVGTGGRVTFSEAILTGDSEARKSSLPSAQRPTVPPGVPPSGGGSVPQRTTQKQPSSVLPKTTGTGKTAPGVMKKADSVGGRAPVRRPGPEAGAKGSPASSRKTSQAAGTKRADAGTKVQNAAKK